MRLLFFYTDWSPRCEAQKKILDDIDMPVFVKEIDYEKNPDDVKLYEVTVVPTLCLVKNSGLLASRLDGLNDAVTVEQWMTQTFTEFAYEI